ncbi:MAG TPA: M28 family peptidase, partial [Gemmatimonadaceae bacterium]|nr:M28 family peptidase [Gemmatimonadaceae bacterium]
MLTALLTLFGCEHMGGARTDFNGETALGYVKTQLDFGPRIPGTDGARKTGDWIIDQMRQRADTVEVQSWNHITAKGDTLPLRNILARFRPLATERVLYVTHWDTRPISDGDNTPPSEKNLPVPGANDGASGVALFLALGDAL